MRHFLSPVLNLLVPPRCLACGAQTLGLSGGAASGVSGICTACHEALHWLSEPLCTRCGLPFDDLFVPDAPVCAACQDYPPPWQRARAPLVYQDKGRELVLAFKHGDRVEAAPWLAQQMRRVAGPLLEEAELLLPVPLHWRRRVSRRYNQAALLALALRRYAPAAQFAPDLLYRVKATAPQIKMSRWQRRRNLSDAFRVRRSEALQNKRVLLIDDVLTSGATARAITQLLLDKGAAAVDILTATRVLPYSPSQ